MAPPVILRPPRPAEDEVLCAITVEAFDGVTIEQNIQRRFGALARTTWQERKAAEVRRELAENRADCFVAEYDGQLVGYVTCILDRAARIGRIPNLAVRRAWRGQGIGRLLLQQALAHLRQQGMTLAKIETLEQNPIGQRLYPSLGFVEVARQIHYIAPLAPLPEPGAGQGPPEAAGAGGSEQR